MPDMAVINAIIPGPENNYLLFGYLDTIPRYIFLIWGEKSDPPTRFILGIRNLAWICRVCSIRFQFFCLFQIISFFSVFKIIFRLRYFLVIFEAKFVECSGGNV